MATPLCERVPADTMVLQDASGALAVLQRHFDADGVEVVRYRPDPSAYHSEAAWDAASAQQVAAWIV